jgi:DNA (cytosine-5)-methyltransferase 1
MRADLSCVDLFCGAGGFSLGFSNAGFEILAASDYHESAEKTYTANLPAPFLREDITNLSSDVQPLLDLDDFDSEELNVVIGGPPCKGFSTAGAYNNDDPRSSLLQHYIRVIGKLRPDAIVMENVPGAKNIADGAYVDAVLDGARDLGYKTRMLELNAADYGVPQFRNRLFFIGYQDEVPVSPPVRTHTGETGQQRLGRSAIEEQYISVADAISDLSFLSYGEEAEEYELPPTTDYQRLMRRNHSGSLYNHIAPDHSKRVRERYEALDEGAGIDDLPQRLQTQKHTMIKYDRSRPANTVTTLPEDFVHYEQPRIPTVRELARLQSFPDWFEFKGPRTTGGPQRLDSLPQYSQVGNAVPPILAEAIGRHMRATLLGNDPAEAAESRV